MGIGRVRGAVEVFGRTYLTLQNNHRTRVQYDRRFLSRALSLASSPALSLALFLPLSSPLSALRTTSEMGSGNGDVRRRQGEYSEYHGSSEMGWGR